MAGNGKVAPGAIFVDGASISHRLEDMGSLRVDWKNFPSVLMKHMGDGRRYPFKAYYTAHWDEASLKRREGYYGVLRKAGWTIFDIPSKQFTVTDADGNERTRYQEKQVDLMIALDAYRLALMGQIGTLILVTHDGDFTPLFKRLPKGVRGCVIGFEMGISMELKKVADVIPLESMKKALYGRKR